MLTRFVGDIHGKFHDYKNIVDNFPGPTVQIGDFGFGFKPYKSFGTSEELLAISEDPTCIWDRKVFDWQVANPRHRFIRGNHDSPSACRMSPNFIEDGTVEGDIMYVGGAWSIDHAGRVEDFSWWPDEEISYGQLSNLIELFIKIEPRVMVTHDFPTSVAYEMFLKGTDRQQFKTRTGEALQAMFDEWQPEIWVGGHWHEDRDVMIRKTRFICLNELETVDIDL